MSEFAFGTNCYWSLINANNFSHLGLTSFDLFHPNGKMRNFSFNYSSKLTPFITSVKENLRSFSTPFGSVIAKNDDLFSFLHFSKIEL